MLYCRYTLIANYYYGFLWHYVCYNVYIYLLRSFDLRRSIHLIHGWHMRQRINNESVCASSPLIFIRRHPTEVLFATCTRSKPRDLTGLLHFLHTYDVMTTRDINQKRFRFCLWSQTFGKKQVFIPRANQIDDKKIYDFFRQMPFKSY